MQKIIKENCFTIITTERDFEPPSVTRNQNESDNSLPF